MWGFSGWCADICRSELGPQCMVKRRVITFICPDLAGFLAVNSAIQFFSNSSVVTFFQIPLLQVVFLSLLLYYPHAAPAQAASKYFISCKWTSFSEHMHQCLSYLQSDVSAAIFDRLCDVPVVGNNRRQDMIRSAIDPPFSFTIALTKPLRAMSCFIQCGTELTAFDRCEI